jgi:AmiR/NasT family two-component response regulator
MTKPFIEIHNITTNEIINREMTNAEFKQYELDLAKANAKLQAEAEAEAAKAALLDRLGITADEAKLLLS